MRLSRQLVATLKAHLAGDKPRVPEAGRDLWQAFIALHATRTVGFGPSAITCQEIAAWAALTRWPIEPHHVDIIRAMDDAWLAWARSQTPGGKPAPVRSTTPISTELFDAMFG